MRVFKSKDAKLNMCNYCFNSFATCNPTVCEFGDGVGKDNVIVCSEFIEKHVHKDIEMDADRKVAPKRRRFDG